MSLTLTATDRNRDTLRYRLDFGDSLASSGPLSANGLTITHVYTRSGTYLVRATVDDQRGGRTSAVAYVGALDAANHAPQAADSSIVLRGSAAASLDLALLTADLDGDGRLDLIAGNFGYNTKYKEATPEKPKLLYYADCDNTGRKNIVEVKREADTLYPERGRSCSSTAMPFLKTKFPTYHAFASA